MRFWKFCIFFVGYMQIWQEVWIKGGPVNATEEKQTPGANYGFIENLVRCVRCLFKEPGNWLRANVLSTLKLGIITCITTIDLGLTFFSSFKFIQFYMLIDPLWNFISSQVSKCIKKFHQSNINWMSSEWEAIMI